MNEFFLAVVNNLDVFSIGVMVASLIPIYKMMQELPKSLVRKKWIFLIVIIFLFIGGYMHVMYQYRMEGEVVSKEVVYLLLFLGAVFVLLTSVLSLQTALDIRHMYTLEQENITDPLIGIKNRRYLDLSHNEEFSKFERYGLSTAVLMIDIDHFKKINDTYGHDVGDEVLKSLGKSISEYIREGDIVARYGGEEFVVVCPSSNAIQASQLAHRLRAYIETLQVAEGELSELRITVSIGVAECMSNFKEADQIVKHADMALYRAKNQGRNCVVVCDESLYQKREEL